MLLALLSWTMLDIVAARAEDWGDIVGDYLLTGQKPHPAVARVVVPDGTGTSLGSGVLVDINASQALLLTNWHVVRDARSAVLVQFPDGFQSAGTVVRVDEVWDLAAIVIWRPSAEPVPLSVRPPVIGEMLTIAGFGRGPYRAVTGACTQYLSPGGGQPQELVELVAVARQGDSGGPIFNASGELAGVLFGESDGRTIGSSSPRIRAFLAAVGSDGYHPPSPQAPSDIAALAGMAPAESTAGQATGDSVLLPGAAGNPRTVAMFASVSPATSPGAASMPTDNVLAPPPAMQATASESAAGPLPAGAGGLPAMIDAARQEPPVLEFSELAGLLGGMGPWPLGSPQTAVGTIGAAVMMLFGLRGIFRALRDG
jgi:S1-C subfamily serine protease